MTTVTTTPWWKKRQVIGLAAVVLVSGAIAAGVLGSRAKTQHNHSEPEAIKVQSEPESGFSKVLDSLFGEKAGAPAEIPSTSTAGSTVVQPQLQVPSSGTATAVNEEAKDDGSLLFAVQQQASDAMVDNQKQAAKTLNVLIAASTGAAFCYPENGKQLEEAVDQGKCTIIALNRDLYTLDKQIVISRSIIIIGNPVVLPEIDGFKNERIFHVVAGGFLEIRFVRLQQGVGRIIPNPIRPIHLRFGTIALVELGGRLSISGCTMETRFQGVASLLKEFEDNFTQQRLTFGGYVAVRGGSVNIAGTTIWRFRPLGNPNLFEVNVGRDVLVIAGTANLVGIFYSSIQLFHNKLSAGGIFCVLGGNLIVTGFALNTITAANSQWGTGLQTYVGGGNFIMTGASRFTASIVLVRGGFGLFSVSAGNMVVTGFVQMSARGASADFGTAVFSVGAGTLTAVGTSLYSVHIARTMHIAGGYWFNGAGVINVIGVARSNMGTSTNQMGIGLHCCNVAGVTTIVGQSTYTCAMARSQMGAGTETFMAAGFLTFVRVFRYRNIGAGLFIGYGNQIYVARGAGVFIRNRQAAHILIDWRTTRNVYTVAGTQTGRAGANTNLYMDASGRYPLGSLGFNDTAKAAKKNGTKRELSQLPLFRKLQTQDLVDPAADTIFPRSFLLAIDDKVFEGPLVIPTPEEIDAATEKGDFPGFSFFRAVEKTSPLDLTKNKLQVSTSNTDCLVCDVPTDQLLGDSPCVASNQCAGKSVRDIIASDETPKGLQEFASRFGWTELAGTESSGTEAVEGNVITAADADVVTTEDASSVHVQRALELANSPDNRPDVWVLEGELLVYCQGAPAATGGNSTCGQNHRNIRSAIAFVLGDHTGAATDFSVSAWDKVASLKSELHDYVDLTEVYASLQAPQLEGATNASSSVFGFTVTVTNEDKRAAAAAAVDALVTDSTLLLKGIDFLDPSSTEYLASKLSRTRAFIVPGNPTGLSGDQLLTGLQAPAIVATVPNSFSGLHTAKIGETYGVSVANFPAGSTVEVNVVDTRTSQVLPGTTVTLKVPLLRGGSTTTSASWSLPEDFPVETFAEGEDAHVYIIQASAGNILLTPKTSPFQVVAA